jgi:Ser/Thr protein kinase RdoA (MazF antagonist)
VEGGGHNTLARPATPISTQVAAALANEFYGLACTATHLEGERDSNFALSTDRGRFMLKIAHPGESAVVAEGQTQVLVHLARVAPALPIPRVIPGRGGQSLVHIDHGAAAGRSMRLTTFVDGHALCAVPTSRELRTNLGRTLAEVGRALRSFSHPAAAAPMLWDIARLPELRGVIEEIDDGDKRARLLTIVDHFQLRTAPALRGLRSQAVHNDFSGDNVLIGENGVTVTGVLDFGDMVSTQLVNDVAVAAAYQLSDGPDPTDTAADVVNGYHQITPLDDTERVLLFDLIIARMATRLALTEWRALRVPDNRRYILRNTPRSWRQLDSLLAASRNDFQNRISR